MSSVFPLKKWREQGKILLDLSILRGDGNNSHSFNSFREGKHLTYRNYAPYNRQENIIGKDCDGDSKLILNV